MNKNNTIYWNPLPFALGQIVLEFHPQVNGSWEGDEGDAGGLSLTFDQSDGDWALYDDGIVIKRGNKFAGQIPPSVDEAKAIKA